MTPPPPLDTGVVAARLRLISSSLDELGALRGISAERLSAEPLTRAAAERLIQVIVDLAVDVNAHVAASVLGAAPETGRSSFEAAGKTGALSAEVAAQLAPTAGLRNVLVHRYVDIRVELVAEAVDAVLDGYPQYVREMAAFARSRA